MKRTGTVDPQPPGFGKRDGMSRPKPHRPKPHVPQLATDAIPEPHGFAPVGSAFASFGERADVSVAEQGAGYCWQ